jgi:hypothetical protein
VKIVMIVGLVPLAIITVWFRLWLPFKSWWEEDDDKSWWEQVDKKSRRGPKEW